MYPRGSVLLIAVGAVTSGMLCFAAARNAYFPTDVSIAGTVQGALSGPTGWASWVTATADKPACFLLLALTIVVAWIISGWRAALLSLPIFFGLWGLGVWLSPLVAQPRPSPELIRVVGHPKGYAFPSIFGLVYVATAGYIGALALVWLRGPLRVIISVLCAGALLIGAAARVVLGAHWPSDLWAAYLIGFVWIGVLIPFSRSDMTFVPNGSARGQGSIGRA
jgi:membrane-associated phospholipid phosphatase